MEELQGKKLGILQLGKIIGIGSYAKVFECYKSKDKFALKLVEKTNHIEYKILLKEHKILRLVEHEHIVSVKGSLDTADHYGIILELIDGIELFEFVHKYHQTINGVSLGLNEETSSLIMKQLLNAVAHIHSLGVSHNDIKLENIMISENPIKTILIDFGLGQIGGSEFVDNGPSQIESLTRGSDVYLSPECVMNLNRDLSKGDIWACGVILFSMCTSRLPFDPFGSDASLGHRSMLRRIASGSFHFTELESSILSFECIDMVKQMLNRDHQTRKSALALLEHDFLNKD